MNILKRVARLAVGATLATGIFAATAAPADAGVQQGQTSNGVTVLDTGWGP